jgi:hypothetical protein
VLVTSAEACVREATTIDPELQRVAYEGLASSVTGRGAVVAVDPENGEILAMASSPSYDPNNIDETFPELARDPDSPLVNRAIQSLYPPGSTFKVITAAAALETLRREGGFLTVNLGTGQGYSVLEMIAAFEEASGRRVPFDIVARRPGDVAQYWADPSLAERLIGWRARRGLKEMCVDTWRWQNANPNGYRAEGETVSETAA